MLKVPTYISRLNKILNEEGDDAGKKYLMSLDPEFLFKTCNNNSVKICNDNNFWKELYLDAYIDISGFPVDTNWKRKYINRYKTDIIDFSPLSNTEKIELLRNFNFAPIHDWKTLRYPVKSSILTKNILYRPILYQARLLPIYQALMIYNNKEKLTNIPVTIEDIIEYYDLNPDVALRILNFYTGANKLEDTGSFNDMFKIAVNKYVDDMIIDMNKNISKLTDVPDYNSVGNNINNTNNIKGVIFCHGHDHRTPTIPIELQDKYIEWTLVDIDNKAKPDVVGSYRSWDTLQKLGLQSYDYVLSHNCPIANSPEAMIVFIRNMRWLLKNGGSLYMIPDKLIHRDNKIADKILSAIIYKYGYIKYIRFKTTERINVVEIIADN